MYGCNQFIGNNLPKSITNLEVWVCGDVDNLFETKIKN